MGKRRNGEIDLLRFIFASFIVFFHLADSFDFPYFNHGNIAVEFFFLVSGFLMAKRASVRAKQRGENTVATETWTFLYGKIKSFYPYYLLATLCQLILVDIIGKQASLETVLEQIIKSLPSLLLIQIPLTKGYTLASSWYLSVMITSMLILYPLLIKKNSFSNKILFPLIFMFTIGYLYGNNKSIQFSWDAWNGFCGNGLLRGLGEIALGGCLFSLSELIERLRLDTDNRPIILMDSFLPKMILTLVKYGCYAVVFIFAIGNHFSKAYTVYFLLFTAIGVLMSFSSLGYTISSNKLTQYLGKISLPIYIFQGFLRAYLGIVVKGKITSIRMLAFYVLIIIISLALYYVTNAIMAACKNISHNIRQKNNSVSV